LMIVLPIFGNLGNENIDLIRRPRGQRAAI